MTAAVEPGQWVDLNDGYGYQRVTHVYNGWVRLEGAGEYSIDQIVDVSDDAPDKAQDR